MCFQRPRDPRPQQLVTDINRDGVHPHYREGERPRLPSLHVDHPIEGGQHPQCPAGTEECPTGCPDAFDDWAQRPIQRNRRTQQAWIQGESQHQANGSRPDHPHGLLIRSQRPTKQPAGHHAEDHSDDRRYEIERLISARVELIGMGCSRLVVLRKEIQELPVDGSRPVCALVPVSSQAVIRRPVGRQSDRGRVKTCGWQRVLVERVPVTGQDHHCGSQLHPHAAFQQ